MQDLGPHIPQRQCAQSLAGHSECGGHRQSPTVGAYFPSVLHLSVGWVFMGLGSLVKDACVFSLRDGPVIPPGMQEHSWAQSGDVASCGEKEKA